MYLHRHDVGATPLLPRCWCNNQILIVDCRIGIVSWRNCHHHDLESECNDQILIAVSTSSCHSPFCCQCIVIVMIWSQLTPATSPQIQMQQSNPCCHIGIVSWRIYRRWCAISHVTQQSIMALIKNNDVMSSSFASVVIFIMNDNINKMHHIIALHFHRHFHRWSHQ
jgi:hypothetical protein